MKTNTFALDCTYLYYYIFLNGTEIDKMSKRGDQRD